MKIVIEYDPINRSVAITDNDFRTFEALGVLEAAKGMVLHNWLDYRSAPGVENSENDH